MTRSIMSIINDRHTEEAGIERDSDMPVLTIRAYGRPQPAGHNIQRSTERRRGLSRSGPSTVDGRLHGISVADAARDEMRWWVRSTVCG